MPLRSALNPSTAELSVISKEGTTIISQPDANEIVAWFARQKGAGVVLPDGWFGRPYDNMHELTFLELRPHKLIIELDNQLLLTLTEPGRVTAADGELLLDGFAQCVFDWQEYGSLRPHATVYESGAVRFVSLTIGGA
jgi:hypothetical protein